jgi:hypothetical protein
MAHQKALLLSFVLLSTTTLAQQDPRFSSTQPLGSTRFGTPSKVRIRRSLLFPPRKWLLMSALRCDGKTMEHFTICIVYPTDLARVSSSAPLP